MLLLRLLLLLLLSILGDADIPIDGGSVDESYPLTDGLGAAAMPAPVGQDMRMRQTHVSPDADASVPMPAFSAYV